VASRFAAARSAPCERHSGQSLIALAATVLTFPAKRFVRAVGLPRLASVFLIAVIVAAIPNLMSAAGVSLLVGPAVVAALYNHLPGRAFVSSVIDGLANQPLSSISRGVEALLTAGFLALGMLVGNTVGAGLGLSYDPERITVSVPVSVLGAAIAAGELPHADGDPRRQAPGAEEALAPAAGSTPCTGRRGDRRPQPARRGAGPPRHA